MAGVEAGRLLGAHRVAGRRPADSRPWRTTRWRFAALGIVLAAGAPGGLLAVRSLGTRPTLAGALDQVRGDRLTFAYVWLSTCAAFATFGFLLGRKTDAVITLSATDPLTGLANRRALERLIEREAKRAARYGPPVALLLLDVDHLKAINDGGGHLAGDAALRHVGATLRSESRGADTVARWGGDEFAVLAPNTGTEDAAVLAERIRRRVASGSAPTPLTVSVGVATSSGLGVYEVSALVARADRALYAAKRGGRNRVVLDDRS